MNIQEIIEAPVGTTMTIARDSGNTDQWERVDGNRWVNGLTGVSLASTFFETPASQDRITLGAQPTVETPGLDLPWYTIEAAISGIPAGRYQAWTQPGNQERLVVFPEGLTLGWVMGEGSVGGAPPELVGRRCWWLHERHLILDEPVVCTREHADPEEARRAANILVRTTEANLRDQIQQSLHEYMEHAGYDPNSDLEEWMENHLNMEARPARQETITVTVEVAGRTDITLGDSDLCIPYVDGNDRVQVDDLDLTVDWTYDVDVEVEVDEGDCGCDEVDRSQVERILEREDIQFTSFEVNGCNCPND